MHQFSQLKLFAQMQLYVKPQPQIQQAHQPHDEATVDIQRENYFTPNHFYCVETICAPCGVVIAWAMFAKSESDL